MARKRLFSRGIRVLRLSTVSVFCVGMIGLGSSLTIPASQLTSSSNPVTTLYASSNGSGGSCTQSSPCGLQTALDAADSSTTADVTIDLVTSATQTGTASDYVGGFTVDTSSASKSFDITIQPAGPDISPVLDGDGTSRVLMVQGSGTLNLVGVTVKNGVAPVGDNGGGIFARSDLTITDSTISGNSAGAGGAGEDGGSGGGIFATHDLTITNSTISDNRAGAGGAGIKGASGISGNNGASGTAGGDGGIGGGILAIGKLTITDSTISGNSAGAGGAGGKGGHGGVGVSGTNNGIGDTGGAGGAGGWGGSAGGIGGGMLTITNSTISSNRAGAGGAGGVGGHCGFGINDADCGNGGAGGNGGHGGDGGGILSDSDPVISNSTISDNSAGVGGVGGDPGIGVEGSAVAGSGGHGGNGGGVAASDLTTTNSTIANNSAGAGGAGVSLLNPGATPADGSNGGDGGGIFATGDLTITNSTIAQNNTGARGIVYGYATQGEPGTGAGIASVSTKATTALTADLIAGGASDAHGKDCAISSTITGNGYNVASDSSCDFSSSSTSEVSLTVDLLGDLEDNGGPTNTIQPSPGNPAINYIPVSSGVCPATDQRGYVRLANSSYCYAGAYQGGYLEPQTISFTSTPPTSAKTGNTYTPTATSTSGLAVALTVAPSSATVCSIASDGVVTFNAAGTCTIDANQAGNSTYAPASQVTQAVTVSTPPVTSPVTSPTTTSVSAPSPVHTSSSSVTAPSTPTPVTLKTGPPFAPAQSTPLVPIGLGLSASGVVSIVAYELRRRRAS